MATVRVETEVELDVAMMAKAFAHMGSDDQAQFLALAHREMGEYTREHRDGTTATLGSYGREMQMLMIKDHFDEHPDAAEFIRTLYEMTHEEDKDTDVAKGAREHTKNFWAQPGGAMEAAVNWDNKKYFEQQAMAEEMIAVGTPTADNRDKERAKTLAYEAATDYLTGNVPLKAIGRCAFEMDTYRCQHPTGARFRAGDRVKVDVSPNMERLGTVTMVHTDGEVDVLLDADEVAVSTNARITCSGDDVVIVDGCRAYVKAGSGMDQGAYIGSVVKEHDDGTVTIDVGGVRAASAADATVIDFVTRNKKAVGDLITSDDVASYDGKFIAEIMFPKSIAISDMVDVKSPNADAAPCEECKGTGTWTNPANAEESPCSRGCKS